MVRGIHWAEILQLPVDLHLDNTYHDSIRKDTTSSGEVVAVCHLSAIKAEPFTVRPGFIQTHQSGLVMLIAALLSPDTQNSLAS